MADLEKVLKRIPDDVVEYKIYPSIPEDCETEKEIQNYLNKLLVTILAHISDKAVNYIWHHEPFILTPSIGKEGTTPPHYFGSTSFGDNIDDEWFIVFLLYEITREFAGTVVKVCDNDEEFLLIEAAESLPSWLDPESAENRVYLYNGDLHVIPIPQSPEEFIKYPMFAPTIDEALVCIRNCACDTRAQQTVQDRINKRIKGFPKKLRSNLHHVNCYLPTPLAALLSDQPTLVSAGVRRFYYRDPLELKACRPMKRFKPDDLVRTRVKMTRCQYAQLSQQRFLPDRRSGWPLVAPSNKEYIERDIGVKLAHGFEILCADCPDDNCINDNNNLTDDSNPKWHQFKKTLNTKGYFRGEIEGSKLYKQLVQEAKQFFRTNLLAQQNEKPDELGVTVLNQIKRLQPTFNDLRLESSQISLPPSDDDSWLTLTPEDVDGMMKQAGGLSKADVSSGMFDLSKVAESMNTFVEHEATVDGAEFPKDTKEDEEGEGDGSTGLIHQMQKMFDFPEDKDSSGSDMSEYDWSEDSEEDLGSPTKMPAAMRKGSKVSSKLLRSNLRKECSTPKESKSKSVRFSGPNMNIDSNETMDNNGLNVSDEEIPPASTKPPTPAMKPTFTPTRPENLPSQIRPQRPSATFPSSKPTPPPRPTSDPPPRPAASIPGRPLSNPPPVPPHPPQRPNRPPKPLSKPNGAVKPNAPPPPPPTAPRREKRDKKLEALMDAMDRELSGTEVGKSFERVPKQSPTKGATKTTQGKKNTRATSRDIDDEDDDFRPVDVDFNIVKNTLESYKAQQGLPGPASNILSGFGIKLPQDKLNGT